jgi:hypothetical protein
MFTRGWAACKQHDWVSNPNIIRIPLTKPLDITHSIKCTQEQDRLLGVLGLALKAQGFVVGGISSLDDAYREAVRCGAIGAEVLLADLGGTSPNSC